ncbi:MAG: glycosyltransferase family 2 protein [Ruthenibacterium sp.]
MQKPEKTAALDLPPEQDSVGKALKRSANPRHFANLFGRAAKCAKERGGEALIREASYRVDLMTKGESWQFRADIPLKKELRAQRRQAFDSMPMISIVVPLYNTPLPYLRAMIKSVLHQSYQHFELVLVDASGPAYGNVASTVKKFSDRRIVLCKLAQNAGIAANTNIGFGEATGDYIALLDHDDTLSPNALYEAVCVINDEKADLIYSDEIVLDDTMKNLSEYHFKPDFSPDTLRGCNYITHFSMFSRALLDAVGGGECTEMNGAQDYDLILRLSEKAQHIVHIPKVLYYWRRHAESTANDISAKPYAIEAGACAVRAQLARLNLPGEVSALPNSPGAYRVHFSLTAQPLITVLIPNMDHTDDLKRCLESLYRCAGYDKFEVLVIENNSKDPATMRFYEAARRVFKNLRFVRYQGGFNFSAINNYGAQFARGEYLLLLNNDIQLLSDGFLREMLSYAQRADVGAVGAKLFYPDDTIQHAGVFIGIGGSAGHNHKGHPRASGGDMYRLATAQNVSAVTGACLMVKKSLYTELGGLDATHFAVAYNDIDFCLRLRAKGLLNVMTPFATAYHYESKSRGDDTKAGGEKQARYETEKAAFREKYAAIMQDGDPYYNPHFTLLYENYGYQ